MSHDSPGDLLLRAEPGGSGALLAGQRALEWLPVNEAVLNRALEVQRLLAANRGNGHRRPIPDLIIVATAEPHGAEVLHVDSGYDMIA